MEELLNQGVVGFYGLYSTNQQDFREMWTDFADWVSDMCNADFDYWNPVRLKLLEIEARYGGNRVESRRQVFAVNTTYYGRAAEEDHQP